MLITVQMPVYVVIESFGPFPRDMREHNGLAEVFIHKGFADEIESSLDIPCVGLSVVIAAYQNLMLETYCRHSEKPHRLVILSYGEIATMNKNIALSSFKT